MTETNQNDASSNQKDPQGSTSQDQKPDQKPDGYVSYETYSKVLGEAKNAKEKLRQLDAEFRKERESKLNNEGDWKGLLEIREKEIAELKGQIGKLSNDYSELDSHVKAGKKLSAVLNKLEGHLDQKYFGLIDLDGIKVNPETGDIDEMSVLDVAQRFKTEYPEVIRKQGHSNIMGDGRSGSGASGSTIGYEAWLKLPYKEQVKFKTSQIIG